MNEDSVCPGCLEKITNPTIYYCSYNITLYDDDCSITVSAFDKVIKKLLDISASVFITLTKGDQNLHISEAMNKPWAVELRNIETGSIFQKSILYLVRVIR